MGFRYWSLVVIIEGNMGYISIYFVLHLTKSRLMLIEDNSSENENLQKWIFEASHFEKKC